LSEEEPFEDQRGGYLDAGISEQVAGMLARVLEGIEVAGDDSKLAAFVALLNHIDDAKTPSTMICVLTDYLGTLFYVAAEMESLGKIYHVFHGGMDAESRQSTLATFSSSGGVLTATRAAISDSAALSEITDLVLYDLPSSPVALQQVLGRFDRFGRRTQLNVYALIPSNSAKSLISQALELFHQSFYASEADAHK
jgi:superfamily II DNA/RNA helicase